MHYLKLQQIYEHFSVFSCIRLLHGVVVKDYILKEAI